MLRAWPKAKVQSRPIVVRNVKIDGLLAQVELDVTKGRLVAVITRESAESLGLASGVSATAVVKATSVMVEP